jgi:hypothetical protein
VISQNINGLPEQQTNYKSCQITSIISQRDREAWLIQEPGLCWPKLEETNQWLERVKQRGSCLYLNFGFNKTKFDRSKALQAGGTAIITTNNLIPQDVSITLRNQKTKLVHFHV